MQIYKIREDGFKEIKKQMLIRTAPIMIIAVAAGLAISLYNSKDKASPSEVLPFMIPFIAATVGFGLYRGINRQRSLFESFQLTLTNNLATREQLNTPTVSIHLNEIKEIIKNKNGSFIIKGKDPADIIIIPAQIEKYSELENTLAQIKPITAKSGKTFLQKYSIPVAILNLALLFCVYTVSNRIIVALSGTLFIIIGSWSLYEVQTSKNVDSKTKRNMWWALLVLVSVIAVMIMKLTAVTKA